MYLAYIDESGIDANSSLMVMVGIVVSAERLRRTQSELATIFSALGGITTGHLKELKFKTLYPGSGVWGRVPGERRREVISSFCEWVGERKHDLALAAIDKALFEAQKPPVAQLTNIWQAGALHVALQLQRAHQRKEGSKGRTILIFDDNKREMAYFTDLAYNPPDWTEDYYVRSAKKPPLDMIIDTPFTVQSHHVALVQVADIFAGIFRRHAELCNPSQAERYTGERIYIQGCAELLSARLLGREHRWPTLSKSECALWYRSVAPASLVGLSRRS